MYLLQKDPKNAPRPLAVYLTSRYLPTKFTGVPTDSPLTGETAGHVSSIH